MIALAGCRCPHEAEEALVLQHAHVEHSAAGLETVLKCLVEVQRSLNLHKCTKFGFVVFYVESVRLRLLLNEGMRT